MFSPEERQRVVELYFTTPMTTAQVVRHLGYPTRRCSGRTAYGCASRSTKRLAATRLAREVRS